MIAGGQIPLHTCTREELGIEGNNSKFFPIVQNSYRDVEIYSEKLRCMDQDLALQGDYNSAKAQVLKLTFEKCDHLVPNNTCKSDEEI